MRFVKGFAVPVLVAAFFIFSGGAVFADSQSRYSDHYKGKKDETACKGKDGRGSAGSFFSMAAGKLDLSDEQKASFARLKIEYKKATIKKKADVKLAKVELSEFHMQDEVDLDGLKKKLEEIALLKADLKFYRFKVREEFKKLLTSKQMKKLKEFMSRHHTEGKYKGYGGREGSACKNR